MQSIYFTYLILYPRAVQWYRSVNSIIGKESSKFNMKAGGMVMNEEITISFD
jgi:hypothetical protein